VLEIKSLFASKSGQVSLPFNSCWRGIRDGQWGVRVRVVLSWAVWLLCSLGCSSTNTTREMEGVIRQGSDGRQVSEGAQPKLAGSLRAEPPPTLTPPEGQELICGQKVEMGTPFKICLHVPLLGAEQAERVQRATRDLEAAFAKIAQMNLWMSDWLPSSELSQVNARAGQEAVAVRPELWQLLKQTLEVARVSQGAFDPSFNVFFGLYNFKPGQEREPSSAEIAQRRPLIRWQDIELRPGSPQRVYLKREGMKLGLGAVGQGYAAQIVADELRLLGYPGGYVDGSGDTIFWGQTPKKTLWTTAIRDPRDHSKIILRIYGTDLAITTAGDDEKFFWRNGQRVHHIIDPRTGRPATKSRQVTVIARRGFDADAWDTAAFVMGAEKAIPILEKRGLHAVIVDDQGRVWLTKGLQRVETEWGTHHLPRWPR
jgi:thiamine biosynthesis lipoprotein